MAGEAVPPLRAPREASPRDLWRAARALSDEPDSEWTFPLFVDRAIATTETGLDHAYEDLLTWEQVREALVVRAIQQHGLSPQMSYQLGFGLEVFEEGLRAPRGRFPLPQPGEPFRGRHYVAGLEWDPWREEVVLVNSWGPRWGDQGLGYLARPYFEAHVDSVILRRPAYVGPSAAMERESRALEWRRGHPGLPAPDSTVQTWGTPNKIAVMTIDVAGRSHELRMRRLLSFGAFLPFYVVELRDGDRLRGRLHLVHDTSAGRGTLTELWVHPDSRGRGYGRTMEETAADLAKRVGIRTLYLPLGEADASPVGRSRAAAFAEALSYSWQWRSTRRPNTIGTATKDLS